jgi:hypothetical protein
VSRLRIEQATFRIHGRNLTWIILLDIVLEDFVTMGLSYLHESWPELRCKSNTKPLNGQYFYKVSVTHNSQVTYILSTCRFLLWVSEALPLSRATLQPLYRRGTVCVVQVNLYISSRGSNSLPKPGVVTSVSLPSKVSSLQCLNFPSRGSQYQSLCMSSLGWNYSDT